MLFEVQDVFGEDISERGTPTLSGMQESPQDKRFSSQKKKKTAKASPTNAKQSGSGHGTPTPAAEANNMSGEKPPTKRKKSVDESKIKKRMNAMADTQTSSPATPTPSPVSDIRSTKAPGSKTSTTQTPSVREMKDAVDQAGHNTKLLLDKQELIEIFNKVQANKTTKKKTTQCSPTKPAKNEVKDYFANPYDPEETFAARGWTAIEISDKEWGVHKVDSCTPCLYVFLTACLPVSLCVCLFFC